MKAARKVRVLVVDDSLLFREILVRELSKDLALEIVGSATDPFMARDKILELEPDVLTLDVEMPKMNGIEFLRRLMPQYPLPVVVVSAIAQNVFEALKAGAVDFATKPVVGNPGDLEIFINELANKIKVAANAKVSQIETELVMEHKIGNEFLNKNIIVAIGASTGGTEAIHRIIKSFPLNMPGVIIVQHMPAGFTRMYAERMNASCQMEVKEAADGDGVEPGRILIAPGDYQMELKKGQGKYFVRCYKGEKVSGHCPSVDVMFNSVAVTVGKNALGVILTGMGSDGAKGLLNMKKQNAYTIGQDEQSCVVYGMPMVAYNLGAVAKQASLEKIPDLIFDYLKGSKELIAANKAK